MQNPNFEKIGLGELGEGGGEVQRFRISEIVDLRGDGFWELVDLRFLQF